MNKIYGLVWLALWLSLSALGQPCSVGVMQRTLHQGIAKAYPASVRMWGYDTLSKQQMSAQFSGVVVSAQGHILTAAHTTIPGKTYQVMFPDGKSCVAVALGKIEFAQDKTRPDVAMMKIITPGKWPYAAMARSAGLQVNQPCISIAYPESLNQPLPMIRFGRVADVKNKYGFIQSTCIMEPGDSGGPLFNEQGQVIALHSAIDVSEDMNFEIPVDYYQQYWTALQQPQVYTAWPQFRDSLPSSKPQAMSVCLQLQNGSAWLSPYAGKQQTYSVRISSNLQGRQQPIAGTLLAVRIYKGKQPLSVVISKSSAVGAEPVVVMKGKAVRAVVIARSRADDLVLLKLPGVQGGIPLNLTQKEQEALPQLGDFLLSPIPDTAVVASVAGTGLFALPKLYSLGYLGAAIAYREGPLLLTVVQPGSPASVAGLQTRDQILNINGVEMKQPGDYGNELQKRWPGDTVKFSYKRGDAVYMKNVILATRPLMAANHPAERFAGGKSSRRDAFDAVLAHDASIKPEQCGGPVLGLGGQFYGINIARYSRVSTLMMPVQKIRAFVLQALQGGKYW